MATTQTGSPSPTRTRGLAAVGGAVAGAVVHVLATVVLDVDLLVPAGPDGGEMALVLPAVLGVALVAGLLGWAAAVGAERFLGRPRGAWTGLAVAVTLLSFVPVLTLVEGTASQVTLVLEHLAVAAVAIPMIARTLPAQR